MRNHSPHSCGPGGLCPGCSSQGSSGLCSPWVNGCPVGWTGGHRPIVPGEPQQGLLVRSWECLFSGLSPAPAFSPDGVQSPCLFRHCPQGIPAPVMTSLRCILGCCVRQGSLAKPCRVRRTAERSLCGLVSRGLALGCMKRHHRLIP